MNWGIIGFGEIAPSFISALNFSELANLVAISSRSKSNDLQGTFRNVTIYSNYEDMFCDSNVDIVYIATTNNLHFELIKLGLLHDKHVVCEKPLTLNYKDSKILFELASSRGLYLLEGMWTRFLPAYRKFVNLLQSNFIGKPKFVKVDFGFLSDWPIDRRLLNPNLYGGTLLDNADYNIFLCQEVFKSSPVEIHAQGIFEETGVESSCSILLKYPCGGLAQLFSSFKCKTNQEAIIYGELGVIKLEDFWRGTNVYAKRGKEVLVENYELAHNGFEYEIESVEKDLSFGRLENKIVPHSTSLQVAAIIDTVKNILHDQRM